MKNLSNMLLLSYLLFLVCCLGGGTTASEQIFCSENTPLRTKYISPFFESHRDVSGCVSSELGAGGSLVHIVRLTEAPASKSVILTISESERLSSSLHLVLDSPSPVSWKVTFKGSLKVGDDSYLRTVHYAKGSKVSTSKNVETTLELAGPDSVLGGSVSDTLMEAWARTRFGALTTMSSASKGANRVSILLSEDDGELSSSCELSPPSASFLEAVKAYSFSRQSSSGCFHEDLAGTEKADLHILDLGGEEDMNEEDGTNVYLTLSPPRDMVLAGKSLKRDLILYLRARRQGGLTWYLQSTGLEGNLTVVFDSSTGSEVHNRSLSPKQNLVLKNKQLKGSYEELLKTAITSEEMSPVAYVKLNKANIISLVVPPKEESKKLSPKSTRKPAVIPLDSITLSNAQKAIRGVMLKHCSQSATVVAVPRPVLQQLGVEEMTLSDPSCKAVKNATHWVLKSPSTSCGSLNNFLDEHTMFQNNLLFSFLPSSPLSGKSLKIAFSCRFKSGLGLMPEEEEYNEEDYETEYDDEYDDYLDDDLPTPMEEEMYKMRVEVPSRELVSERSESADVVVGDVLTVQTDFETRATLSLAIDRCWISGHKRGHLDSDTEVLIEHGCPTSPNVSFLSSVTSSPTFTFRVSESHLQRFPRMYIFCVMGLCAPPNGGVTFGDGMEVCVDPRGACGARKKPVPAPVALQMTRRGPLRVHKRSLDGVVPPMPDRSWHTTRKETSEATVPTEAIPNDDFLEDDDDDQSVRSSQHVVMVGVPAEIAVAISLASFIIGAGLTGLLCCVHHRNKEAPKVVRVRADATLDGSELQSMIGSVHPNANNTNHNVSGGSPNAETPLKADMEC